MKINLSRILIAVLAIIFPIWGIMPWWLGVFIFLFAVDIYFNYKKGE